MRVIWFILKLLLKIVVAPVILALTLFVWLCAGLVYLSGLVLGLISTFFAFCGVFMLIVGPRQNGIIALIWHHRSDTGFSDFSIRIADGCYLAAGESSGFEICDSG